MEQDINYYKERLKCTMRLCKEASGEDKSMFEKNAPTIRKLVDGYRQFPEHNELLAGAVERFVLNR